MNCMKCGKNTEENQIFCSECLAQMEAYPVKPGTPVHIPTQPQHVPLRKSHRRVRSVEPEEQIRRLKSTVKKLIICLVILLLAWAATIALAIQQLQTQNGVPIGQNYGVSTNTNSTFTGSAD